MNFKTVRWFLVFLFLGVLFQGFCTIGLVKAVITTVERGFGLNSIQSGLINSMYDIGTLLASIPVTYYGGRIGASKPKWIGAGLMIVSLGSLLWTIPHFVSPYQDQTQQDDMGSLVKFQYFFILGQLLIGVGAVSLVNLGVPYIDDNVDCKKAPLYIAVFQSGTIFGPALGMYLFFFRKL